jgi:hypothetical protein
MEIGMTVRLYLRALAAVAAVSLTLAVSAGERIAGAAGSQGQSLCIAHHPQDFVWYTQSCTGHDEPELDPLSSAAGSAQDLTWTVVLPTNGSTQVDAVGPNFYIGGVVSDPTSLYGQAYLELQFYPNSVVTNCASGGGYSVTYTANVYTACAPVWKVLPHGNSEPAAFNAMLTDSATGGPLQMNAGDTITDHQYTTPAQDGMHITVTDVTTGHVGSIILNSKTDGPLMPAYSTQQIGNNLGWGLVNDAPNALVWEIGHTGDYTHPAGQYCLPGSATKPPCYSYEIDPTNGTPNWLGFSPLQVKSVTFGDGSTDIPGKSGQWAVVSDYGGEAEINQDCGAGKYGTPFCWYPWYAYNSSLGAITYGGDYAGTKNDYGQALQFTQTTGCASPSGPDTTYCATVLK